jgi:tetratricopeptide (TPR) repeat protein
MLMMIDRAKAQVGPLPEKTQTRLDSYTQQYSRLLDKPFTSLDAFIAESQTTRFRLNKIYTSINQIAEAKKQQTVLIYAGVITLIVLGSLAWGLYNTRSIQSGGLKKSRSLFKWAVFVLLVLAFFALPIFRVPAAEVETVTIEAQEAQSILDTADRAATAADRAQARTWMLARLGAAWNEIDPIQAQTVLEEALTSVQQARENKEALWGQSLSVQETTIGVSIGMEKASLIATDLNAARARAWSVPLIAVELNKVDPVRAAELLQVEQASLESRTGIYCDLQLRGLALAWAEIEQSKEVTTAGVIHDASIRAWTLREAAVITNDESLFDLAVEAARKVEDPVQRARALREIAVASGNSGLFDEALAALDGVTGTPLAYALSDLAAASGDGLLVERIPESFPDARVAALLRLGNYSAAQRSSELIIDPYEQARAQAAIASAWANADAAIQIEVPLYRDLALRDVIRNTGNAILMDSIQSAYYQVQALTALGDYEKAIESAGGLGDSYPLVELASALGKDNPQAALELVEKMTRESDKAVVLRNIALVTNDQSTFEQAQGMALAARVQGDVLAPSRASLDLANAFWQVNADNAEAALRQAYEAALRISTR